MQRHRQNKYCHKHISGNKSSYSSHIHVRATYHHTYTQRFTPVWKDKHQTIHKSVSLETCWPPPLLFCHTHTTAKVKVRQGWAEGHKEVKVPFMCVGMQADKTVLEVNALPCGRGLAASMFWQLGHELWPHQTLRDGALWSGGTVTTNWHNLPSPICQCLFKWTRIIRVAQGGCVWVAFCYC